MTSVKWEDGKPNIYLENWLCPSCNSRPDAGMKTYKDWKCYCLYCGEELNFPEYWYQNPMPALTPEELKKLIIDQEVVI